MATGTELAKAGFKYIGTPYSVMDCQAFVEKCLSDCGIHKNLAGSNAWYREMTWVGTPEECKKKFGTIPVGAFLFILEFDGKEPGKYKQDGIGNASHIGIYTNEGKGAINSSSTRGCVCESAFSGKAINGGWNRVGLWKAISYGEHVDFVLDGGEGKVAVDYQAKVVGGKLNMRKSPSSNSERLCQIPDGSIISISEENGAWGKTLYGGQIGWVLLQYTEKVPVDDDTVAVSRAELEKVYDIIGDWLGRRG